ncbi:unnamed protein product [Lampetra fluviatilis]
MYGNGQEGLVNVTAHAVLLDLRSASCWLTNGAREGGGARPIERARRAAPSPRSGLKCSDRDAIITAARRTTKSTGQRWSSTSRGTLPRSGLPGRSPARYRHPCSRGKTFMTSAGRRGSPLAGSG